LPPFRWQSSVFMSLSTMLAHQQKQLIANHDEVAVVFYDLWYVSCSTNITSFKGNSIPSFYFNEVTMTINDTLRLLRSLIPVLLVGALSVSTVLAQSPCEKELAEADAKLQLGYLDEAAALVNRCLNKSDLGTADSARCFLLFGRIHLAKSFLDSARVYLLKLLTLIPDWHPDPAKENPSFKQLADKVILEFKAERLRELAEQQKTAVQADTSVVIQPQKKSGGRKWLWIGGGAAAAGAAAFLIFRGEEKVSRLPDPPDLPSK